MNYCPDCGTQVSEEHAFCYNCGVGLSETSESSESGPAEDLTDTMEDRGAEAVRVEGSETEKSKWTLSDLSTPQRAVLAVGAMLLVMLVAFPPYKHAIYTFMDQENGTIEWSTEHRWIGTPTFDESNAPDTYGGVYETQEINIPFMLFEALVVVVLTAGGIILFERSEHGT